MNTIKVFIPGEPAAKERPRSGKGGRIYTPAKTHKAEQALRQNWIAVNMEQYGSVHTFEEPPMVALLLTAAAVILIENIIRILRRSSE